MCWTEGGVELRGTQHKVLRAEKLAQWHDNSGVWELNVYALILDQLKYILKLSKIDI